MSNGFGRIIGSLLLLTGVAASAIGNPVPPASKTASAAFVPRLWAMTAERWRATRTIIVDGSAATAADSNPGTRAAPLKTIQAALDQARPGTRIVVRSGIYRETLELRRRHSGTAAAPVVLEAEKANSVILSGADVWTGWKPLAGMPGVYSHPWEYTWGFAEDSFARDGAPNGLRGRRSEMVFVNGGFLRQVFSRDALTPGTFFVTQRQKRVFLMPPANTVLAKARVEVAVRERGIDSGSLWGETGDCPRWLVVRGLSVRQYRGFLDSAPAVTLCGVHLLMEKCDISWNGGTGFGQRAEDVVVRQCRVNHNGFSGMVVPPAAYPASRLVLWEGNDTSYNNWRGAMGGFYSYAVAGIKVHRAGDFVLRAHSSTGNRCPGVWFDSEDRNILVERGNFANNREGDGLILELSKGPFLIRDTRLVGNQTGLGISNASHIAVERCVIADNAIQIGGWTPGRDREGYRYGDLALRECVITATNRQQSLVRMAEYADIYDTLRSSSNRWSAPPGNNWYIGERALDFAGWKARTKQDRDSVFRAVREPRSVARH